MRLNKQNAQVYALSFMDNVSHSSLFIQATFGLALEVSQVLFRLSRWENLEHAKEI